MRKIIFLTVLSFSLLSCGGPKAFYDYDEQVNFDNYQSFSFFEEMKSGLRPLDEERLEKALQNQLKENGFTSTQTPDFKVNFYADFYSERSNNTIGIGIGGGGGHVGGGVSGGIPIGGVKTFMSLTIEFVKANNNELFWQAVVESRFEKDAKPEERTEYFMEIVQKALEAYPPEKKK